MFVVCIILLHLSKGIILLIADAANQFHHLAMNIFIRHLPYLIMGIFIQPTANDAAVQITVFDALKKVLGLIQAWRIAILNPIQDAIGELEEGLGVLRRLRYAQGLPIWQMNAESRLGRHQDIAQHVLDRLGRFVRVDGLVQLLPPIEELDHRRGVLLGIGQAQVRARFQTRRGTAGSTTAATASDCALLVLTKSSLTTPEAVGNLAVDLGHPRAVDEEHVHLGLANAGPGGIPDVVVVLVHVLAAVPVIHDVVQEFLLDGTADEVAQSRERFAEDTFLDENNVPRGDDVIVQQDVLILEMIVNVAKGAGMDGNSPLGRINFGQGLIQPGHVDGQPARGQGGIDQLERQLLVAGVDAHGPEDELEGMRQRSVAHIVGQPRHLDEQHLLGRDVQGGLLRS
mmetsp:Transcript_8267/g.19544  ORF Transcript_8267/g.19544 Transcript_8267/m.19544 type:complete len:399 (+) Transcript_8267:381-1577(+)